MGKKSVLPPKSEIKQGAYENLAASIFATLLPKFVQLPEDQQKRLIESAVHYGLGRHRKVMLERIRLMVVVD